LAVVATGCPGAWDVSTWEEERREGIVDGSYQVGKEVVLLER